MRPRWHRRCLHLLLPSACPQVGKEKLSVRYTGPAQHDNDVGSIQVGAARPAAAACI